MSSAKRRYRIVDGVGVDASVDRRRAMVAVRRYKAGEQGISNGNGWSTEIRGVRVYVLPAFLVPEWQLQS